MVIALSGNSLAICAFGVAAGVWCDCMAFGCLACGGWLRPGTSLVASCVFSYKDIEIERCLY